MNARITRSLRRAAVCACLSLLATLLPSNGSAKPAAPQAKLGTPTLVTGNPTQTTIDVTFIAGNPGGAPAGFTLQWATQADYIANDNMWPSTSCGASFSGNASGHAFSLPNPGDSITVTVPTFANDMGVPGFSLDDPGCFTPLVCGTTYVFQAFSHNVPQGLNRSDDSAVVTGTTLPCSTGCTLTQGYWKNHPDAWLLTTISLGNVSYSAADALMILETPPAGGNGLVSLAHQLIAAELSIAGGADPTPVAGVIADANALIGGLVVPPIGGGYIDPSVSQPLTEALDEWLTTNDCSDDDSSD